METIRQLEHNHAGVLGHSQQHLAYRLRSLAVFKVPYLLRPLIIVLGLFDHGILAIGDIFNGGILDNL